MKEAKRLYRSSNRIIFGVIGGFAEYFNINAKNLRITVLIIMMLSSVALDIGFSKWIIIYLVASVIMPAPKNSLFNMLFSANQKRSSYDKNQDNKRSVKDIDAIEIDEDK